MFPQIFTELGRDIGKGLAIALVAIVVITSACGFVAGISLTDTADTHAGIASAQPENETDGRTDGVGDTTANESETGNSSDDSDEDGSAVGGEVSPMEERADSQVPDSSEEQANESAEAENETATDRRADSQVPTDGPSNASTGDDFRSGDRDDDDSGVGFVAQQVISMIEGLTAKASQEFGAAVELLMEYGVTRAAPGDAELSIDAIDTWTNPEDPLWQGSMDGMSISRGFGIILVIFAVWYGITNYGLNPSRSKSIFATSAVSAVFLADPAFWTALSIHGMNAIGLSIVPGSETYATPEGVLLVLSTALLAGLLAAGSLWIVGLAIVVTVLAHNATHVTMALLPIAAGLYPYPMYPRSIAKMIVWLHGATLATVPLQALGTFITTRMFFAGTEAGALESMAGVFAFLGLIYIAYYKIPKEIFEKAFDAPITSLGVNGARMSLDGAQNVKATISNAPEAFKETKTRIEKQVQSAQSTVSRSDPAPAPSPRTVGQVTATSAAGGSGGGSDGRTTTTSSGGSGSGFNAQSRPEPNPNRGRERNRIGGGYY